MQCGAKCFLVEMNISGETKKESVIARTQITARKTIRNHYGKAAEIISVTKKE